MQIIFDAKVTPREYHQQGRSFQFPTMHTCQNPACKLPIPPQKHGFYDRNIIDEQFSDKILIRRYRCPYCGMTFSFLPSFCLPYFQYTLEIIFLSLLCFLGLDWAARDCLKAIISQYDALFLRRQNIEYYARRFLANLNLIKVGLRQMLPYIPLPPSENKKEAQRIISIVSSGFSPIHTFSQRFFEQCQHSFMAPHA